MAPRVLSFLAVLISFTVAAIAEEPRSVEIDAGEVGGLHVGSVLVYDGTIGETSIRYLGQDGDLYRFAKHIGGEADDPATSTFWLDRKGQTVRVIEDDGEILRFEPHDCSRTRGECHYAFHSELGSQTFRRQNERQGRSWRYRIFWIIAPDVERVSMEGEVTIDRYGLPISESFVGGERDKETSYSLKEFRPGP